MTLSWFVSRRRLSARPSADPPRPLRMRDLPAALEHEIVVASVPCVGRPPCSRGRRLRGRACRSVGCKPPRAGTRPLTCADLLSSAPSSATRDCPLHAAYVRRTEGRPLSTPVTANLPLRKGARPQASRHRTSRDPDLVRDGVVVVPAATPVTVKTVKMAKKGSSC